MEGSLTLALLLGWSPLLSSTRANRPARQTFFTKHFCLCSGSQGITFDGQQDAAGLSAGGPETHVVRLKGDGPDGCDGRNGRQRPHHAAWESSRSGHLIYPGPAGKRKEEREPRVKKKRKPDVGSAHASTLRPAPQFPSVRLRMLGGHGRTQGPSPPNTPGLGYPAEPFLLTTLRGHDPQWARCTGTITASSLPTPL